MQRSITGYICIFLTLIAGHSDAKADVLPFNRLGFDAACDKESTKDILKQVVRRPENSASAEVGSGRGVYLVGRTARSNDDVFLDGEIRRRFAVGVVESDAIVVGDLDVELENSCLFYDVLALEWDQAESRWRCLQRQENHPNAALSLRTLDANVADFYYSARCITKDKKSIKVAEYNAGYRLCSNQDNENHLKALKCSKKHKQLIGCFYKGNNDGWTCQELTHQDCLRAHSGDGGAMITKVCTADGNSFDSLCEVLSTANRKLSAAVAVVMYEKPCPALVAHEPYYRILAPALYKIEEGQVCSGSALKNAALVRHYDVYGVYENGVIALCYICHDATHPVVTVTEIIYDTVNNRSHDCRPIDSTKTLYVFFYKKTVKMKEFDEHALSRIFFEDYHKEYMTEFTFAYFAGMDIVMSSKPAPTPNQYELKCAFKKYKDIKMQSKAFYGLEIRLKERNNHLVGSMNKPPSVFSITKIVGQYTCIAYGFYNGAYSSSSPLYELRTSHTIEQAPVEVWAESIAEKDTTTEIISYVLICIITGVIIVVLAVICFFQYKRRASRLRIEYLTGESGYRTSDDGAFERRATMNWSHSYKMSSTLRNQSIMKAKKCENIDDDNESATKTKLSRIHNGKKSSAKTQSSVRVAVAVSSSRRPKTKYTSKKSKVKLTKKPKVRSKSKSNRLSLPPRQSL